MENMEDYHLEIKVSKEKGESNNYEESFKSLKEIEENEDKYVNPKFIIMGDLKFEFPQFDDLYLCSKKLNPNQLNHLIEICKAYDDLASYLINGFDYQNCNEDTLRKIKKEIFLEKIKKICDVNLKDTTP